jgi:HSP20 family protein
MTEKREENKSQRPSNTDSTALAMPRFGPSNIFEDFMRPFNELMEPFFPSSAHSMWTELVGREPVIDLQDRGDHYIMTAELPGFEKKGVEVEISSNVLELKADRSSDKETKSKKGTQIQSTRSYFHRVMTLPDEVLAEKVSGTMKNGVLELRLPKRESKAGDKSRRVDLK